MEELVLLESQQLHEQFIDLVKNQDIAIVGPAGYLKGAGLGSRIDAFDRVVRINRGVETTITYPEDVGTRTDILYSCLLETNRNAGNINCQLIRRSGVQLICAPGFQRMGPAGASIYANHKEVAPVTWRKLRNHGYFPPRLIPEVLDTRLKSETKTRPNTGFLAIYDLLEARPRSLTIFGFTFYLDGFIPGTKRGVETEGYSSEQDFAAHGLKSKRHDQQNLWDYARKTLPTMNNVYLDEPLKTILSLTTFGHWADAHKVR